CGFTVKTVGAASPCVHPEEAASLLQACGLAQDDEVGTGLAGRSAALIVKYFVRYDVCGRVERLR
ncbi:hypothetical protein FOZ62_020528, partial [Perkinsus olseni]